MPVTADIINAITHHHTEQQDALTTRVDAVLSTARIGLARARFPRRARAAPTHGHGQA